MKTLAKTIINLAAFLELSSEDEIDPDTSIKALEQMMSDLANATDGEKEILKAVMRQEIIEIGEERSPEQAAKVEFYSTLLSR